MMLLSQKILQNTRSRYSKYVYYNYRHVKLRTHGKVLKRDCAPSRIPVRTLKSLRNKSRKHRQFQTDSISRSFRSSAFVFVGMSLNQRLIYGLHHKWLYKPKRGAMNINKPEVKVPSTAVGVQSSLNFIKHKTRDLEIFY